MLEDWKKQARQALEKQQFPEAYTLLTSGLAEHPDDLEAIDIMGFVCFFLDRFSESLQWNRKALAIEPQHAYALKGLGLCLHRLGRSEEGLESLQLANAVDPGFLDAWHDRIVVLFELGRLADARSVLADAQTQNTSPQAKAFFAPLSQHLNELDR